MGAGHDTELDCFLVGPVAVAGLLVTLLLAATTGCGPQTSSGPPTPALEIDLTRFGFQGRPPVPLGEANHWSSAIYQQGVAFTGPDTIAAFFVVHEGPVTATPRSPQASQLNEFRFVA